MGRILFVTGTDTGIGKTLLTALLLEHLRSRGIHALAMKPFCTGERADVTTLQALQPGELSDDEVNPCWFKAPLAPALAARLERRAVSIPAVVAEVRDRARHCEVLLVEGVGGVLVPVTSDVTVADFAVALGAEVLVVGCNRLGVLNHVGLTLEALAHRGLRCGTVVLMEPAERDLSSSTNAAYLTKAQGEARVLVLPFLGAGAGGCRAIRGHAKKFQKTLARICDVAIFSPRSLERRRGCGADQTERLTRRRKTR